MKKLIYFIILMLFSVLTACSNESSIGSNNEEINNKANNDLVSEENLEEEEIYKIPTKEEYDYNNYITDQEKINFYKDNEILLGEEFNQEEDVYLVYVFSPVCVYCDNFYDTLAMYSKLDDSLPIYNINVDIAENIDIWSKYEVEGTPTLLLIDKNEEKVLDKLVGIQEIDALPRQSDIENK